MFHFLCGSTLSNFCGLFLRYGPPAPRYWGRTALVFLVILIRTPFSLGQKLIFERRIRGVELDPAPVFILGHWRSGTTLLHKLLSESGEFAFVSYLQALLPWDFLGETRGWRAVLKRLMPDKRPMDEVALDADAPAEEGLALANMCAGSFYHAFCFPDCCREIFKTAVLEPSGRARENYLYFLKKASLACGGKRLLLKDPMHTARVAELCSLFPQARFIFLERNSAEVIPSFERMFGALSPVWRFRDAPDESIHAALRWIHHAVLKSYAREKESIPAGFLLEVRYADLTKDPAGVTRRIRDWLEDS